MNLFSTEEESHITTSGQALYFPWGTLQDNKVYWSEDTTNTNDLTNISATLKSGIDLINWWLRSPDSTDTSQALFVNQSNRVDKTDVNSDNGVRPAFKLDPNSVIFASEIKSSGEAAKGETVADGSNYFQNTAGRNFKLTVVNNSLTLTDVTAGGDTVDSSHPTKTTEPGGKISVAATGGVGTNLTYKIIDSNRKIAGYGQGANNTAVTVAAKDREGNNLVAGDYTVYVWAQKNNEINSHEGSKPVYFTMKVETPVPTDITADFTDPNFKAAVYLQIGKTDPQPILSTDLNTITNLDVSDKGIQSLAGIEHFTALTELYCYSNQLTKLDVTGLTALTKLSCDSNQLTKLDVTGLTALTELLLGNQLTTLDEPDLMR